MNDRERFDLTQKLYRLLDEHERTAAEFERHGDMPSRGRMVAARLAVIDVFDSITIPPCPHDDHRDNCALCQEGPMVTEPPDPMGDGEDVWFWRNRARGAR